MAYRDNLQLWVREALGELGGEGSILAVSKLLWRDHENEFRQAGDAFYKWQYDMRWAAQELRDNGKLTVRKEGSSSIWVLKGQ